MHLLIVGSSARSAAQSARRAGLQPTAIDLFGDLDLRACGPSRQVVRLDAPGPILEAARALAHGPWIYTGGLENQPAIIAALARERPLWGIAGAALATLRDPFALAALWRQAGIPCPETRPAPDHLPRDGSWLVKPLCSAGGLRVRPLDVEHQPNDRGAPFTYQRRIAGPSCGAVFLGLGRQAWLLGATRHRVGEADRPYAYAGCLGPLDLEPAVAGKVAELGQSLASALDLRGLFGVDFILADDRPWPVEVNPRYTGSVELLEAAAGVPFLELHRACFEAGSALPATPPIPSPGRYFGKAVLFARRSSYWYGSRRAALVSREDPDLPELADLPPLEAIFRRGEPIVTAFARGSNLDECSHLLDRKVQDLRRHLWE